MRERHARHWRSMTARTCNHRRRCLREPLTRYISKSTVEAMKQGNSMIQTLLDACRYVLEDQGEVQSSYWLSSIMLEMKLWRASESQVRRTLERDIKKYGESSSFVKVAEDLYALRSWKA